MAIQAVYKGNPSACREILAQAFKIKRECQASASESLATARKNAAANIRNIRKRARTIGLKHGHAAAKSELIAELYALRSRYASAIRQANRDCLELALNVTRQIIGAEMANNTKVLAARITQALEGLSLRGQITIALSPKDYSEDIQDVFGVGQYTLVSKQYLEPGTFRLESAEGSVSIDWRDHFDLIEQALQAKLSQQLDLNRT